MAESNTGRGRTRLVVALGVVILLLAGVVTWFVTDQREQEVAVELERAVQAYADASAELGEAITALNTEVAAAQLVAAEVEDHPEAAGELAGRLVALEAIIVEADEAVAGAAELDSAGTGGAATAAQVFALATEKSQAAAGIREVTEEVVTARERLVDELAAIRVAAAEEALDAAQDDLRAVIRTATSTLSGSEGKVADDAVRERLAAALASAEAVLVEPHAGSEPALIVQTGRVETARAELERAEKAVADARRAWEDAQAELAKTAAAVEPQQS